MTGVLELLLVCAALSSMFPSGFKYATYVLMSCFASYFVVGFPLVFLLNIDFFPSMIIVGIVGFIGGCAWTAKA